MLLRSRVSLYSLDYTDNIYVTLSSCFLLSEYEMGGLFMSCFKQREKQQLDFNTLAVALSSTDKTIKTARDMSIVYMTTDQTLFHSTDHVENVAQFMQIALNLLRITELDDTRLGSRKEFDLVMVCAAYLHDIGHPAGSDQKRQDIEELASACIDSLENRMSLQIDNYIELSLDDIHGAKLEHLHALIGYHYASNQSKFTSYQRQFMICMILATDLKSYADIQETNLIFPTAKQIGRLFMRCSDLCHFTFSWKQHMHWVQRLSTELSTTISPAQQVEFIDTYVLPQYNLLHCFLRAQESLDWISSIQANKTVWESMMRNSFDKSE